MRWPTAGDLMALGFAMIMGSMAIWVVIRLYAARHQIFNSLVYLFYFALDWPEGTLMTTGFIGFLLLYIGFMACLET